MNVTFKSVYGVCILFHTTENTESPPLRLLMLLSTASVIYKRSRSLKVGHADMHNSTLPVLCILYAFFRAYRASRRLQLFTAMTTGADDVRTNRHAPLQTASVSASQLQIV